MPNALVQRSSILHQKNTRSHPGAEQKDLNGCSSEHYTSGSSRPPFLPIWHLIGQWRSILTGCINIMHYLRWISWCTPVDLLGGTELSKDMRGLPCGRSCKYDKDTSRVRTDAVILIFLISTLSSRKAREWQQSSEQTCFHDNGIEINPPLRVYSYPLLADQARSLLETCFYPLSALTSALSHSLCGNSGRPGRCPEAIWEKTGLFIEFQDG